ncbi:MAG TPA: dienelactone hydrolase family protein [Candidatus Baltobacteraceae bacterium]|nr:dienelactone hydrolase family protein [Candidatus Baltobacteraceae bacterium]
MSDGRERRRWAALCMAILLLAGLFAVTTERSALPAPTGPFPVGVTTLRLVREMSDAVEPGTYEIQIWYPGQASGNYATYGTGGPGLRRFVYHRFVRTHASQDVALAAGNERFPVIVYVAGWGGQRTDNTILAEELASHGFVVAALSDLIYDEPPSPDLAKPPDFSSQGAYEATLWRAQTRLAYETRRVSEVLDELQRLARRDPAGRFTNRLRLSGSGVVGFSFGGAVALAACGRDPRCTASVDIDGWLFGVRNTLARPYLLISDNAPTPTHADLASADPNHRYESILTAQDETVQSAALAHDGYTLKVDGATHLDFTDAPSYSPRRWYRRSGLEPARMMRILNRYTLGFFQTYLAGRSSPLLVPGTGFDAAATLTRAGGSHAERRESAS